MMKTQLPRASYVPKGVKVRVRPYEDIPAVVVYDSAKSGRPVALAWRGKAQKPSFHYSFRSPEFLERYIDEWLDGQRKQSTTRAQRIAQRQKGHTLKVGQVLRTCWGYDQTNIDYYQVTAKIGRSMVEIRQIGCTPVGEQGGPSELVGPAIGKFIGEPMRKRPSGDSVFISDGIGYASPYNGEPASRTGFGYGH